MPRRGGGAGLGGLGIDIDKYDLIGPGINTAVTGIGLTVSRSSLMNHLETQLENALKDNTLGFFSGNNKIPGYLGKNWFDIIRPYIPGLFDHYFNLYSPAGIATASMYTFFRNLGINALVTWLLKKMGLNEDDAKKYGRVGGTAIDFISNLVTMVDVYNTSKQAIDNLVTEIDGIIGESDVIQYIKEIVQNGEKISINKNLVVNYLKKTFSTRIFEKAPVSEIFKGVSTVYDKFVPNINLGIQLPTFLSTPLAQYIFGTVLNDVVLGAIALSFLYGVKNKSKKYIAASVMGAILYGLFRII